MQLAPSALHATAETLGGYLGWTLNELIIDDIISLDGPQDRQIGMRLLGNGSNIQLWATGGTEPADHKPTEGTAALPRGHRWHTWIHIGRLEADRDPAAVLYDHITDCLTPVFEAKPLYVGHRPWEEVFDSALSKVIAESASAAGTSLRDCGPEAHTEPHDAGREEAAEAAPESQPAPEPAPEPQPEPQSPEEPSAKAIPMRPRRKPAPKADTTAADGKPARPARKRTPAKPAAAKTGTPAADDKPKPRPARKRTPAKPAADKPTAS
ncbi:hypothetical protein ABZ672_04240 [Streptomyces mirabilis]|uniref:hypothetical protein n=1 Tax=Streptomyces mirabilis TaxID=68239 RepID=UPI0033C2D196